jgi:hypothetical protein
VTQGTDSRTTEAKAIAFRVSPPGICFARAIAALLLGLATVVFTLCSAVQAANLAPCIRKSVRFDGSGPLQFGRVTGLSGARLYIHPSYPKSCNSSTRSCAGTRAYLLTGDEVAVGKNCGKWTYIQYIGQSRITEGWVARSNLKLLRKVGTGMGTPLFTLIKGRGTPVCEAYLQRLNVTDYRANYPSPPLPYCGIPENDDIPGFRFLHRVPLPSNLVVKMSGELSLLWHPPNPHLNERPVDDDGLPQWVGSRMKAWRYNPGIDVDNDGIPDDIVVWQGYGLSDSAAVCGEPFSPAYTWGFRPPQMPLVIKSDLHVDLQSTASMFGRSGVVRPKTFQSVIGPPPFHPIGHFITLFNYRRLTYIAALFDAGGDFAGRRKGDAGLANVLGVFLAISGFTNDQHRRTFWIS